ncbi:hypothetical protein Bbelb_160690 [Branchiostoma belcheri]|nr:hypothetical protein Bbelb_160690 [Branchiostoma belcheri]
MTTLKSHAKHRLRNCTVQTDKSKRYRYPLSVTQKSAQVGTAPKTTQYVPDRTSQAGKRSTKQVQKVAFPLPIPPKFAHTRCGWMFVVCIQPCGPRKHKARSSVDGPGFQRSSGETWAEWAAEVPAGRQWTHGHESVVPTTARRLTTVDTCTEMDTY